MAAHEANTTFWKRKMKRYLVFLKAEYVRDAQGYFPGNLSEAPEEDEEHWFDVGGPVLVMDTQAENLDAIHVSLGKLYPNTTTDVFEVYEVRGMKQRLVLNRSKMRKSED